MQNIVQNMGGQMKSKSTTKTTSRLVMVVLVAMMTVAIAGVKPVAAHFVLENSRELIALNRDDEMYLPYYSTIPLGFYDTRAKKDCLQYPKTKPAYAVAKGSSVTLKFIIKDTADHEGMCRASLHDSNTGALVANLKDEKDCVANNRAITVKIPANAACEACVVKVAVRAVHISEDQPELYDSCVDISATGGSGTATNAVAPPQPSQRVEMRVPTMTQGQKASRTPAGSQNNKIGSARQPSEPSAPIREDAPVPITEVPSSSVLLSGKEQMMYTFKILNDMPMAMASIISQSGQPQQQQKSIQTLITQKISQLQGLLSMMNSKADSGEISSKPSPNNSLKKGRSSKSGKKGNNNM